MGEFIKSHNIWITPAITIVLTIVMKIAAKPDSITITYKDWLDFGFDISISAIICLIAAVKNDTGVWLIVLSFFLMILITVIVNRTGWDRTQREKKLIGIIIPDIMGVFILAIVMLYNGGVII